MARLWPVPITSTGPMAGDEDGVPGVAARLTCVRPKHIGRQGKSTDQRMPLGPLPPAYAEPFGFGSIFPSSWVEVSDENRQVTAGTKAPHSGH